jgi:carboxymethylenebutenolidase
MITDKTREDKPTFRYLPAGQRTRYQRIFTLGSSIMNIKKREFEIATPTQKAQAFLFIPEGGPKPGVLLYTDIKGIRATTHEMAERLAAQGFAVLMPHVFYRAGDPPLFTFPFQPGEERTVKRLQELKDALTSDMQLEDSKNYVHFLEGQSSVRPGPMGVVGYCYTGGMAMRTAAVCPDKIRAAASFHGGGLANDLPTSPHLHLPKIKAALYFGHAVEDKSMQLEEIKKLGSALEAWGGRYVNKTYEGALHGWTKSDSPIYNPAQAEAAFKALTEFLKGSLT